MGFEIQDFVKQRNQLILLLALFVCSPSMAQRIQVDVKAGTAASSDIHESLGNLNDPKISAGKMSQHNYDLQAEVKLLWPVWIGAGVREINFSTNSLDNLSLRELYTDGRLDHFEGKFILKARATDNTDLGGYVGLGIANSKLDLETFSIGNVLDASQGSYSSNFFTARIGAKGFHYFQPITNFGVGGEVYAAPLLEFGRSTNGDPTWLQGNGFNGKILGYSLDLRYLFRIRILRRPLTMHVAAGVDHQDISLRNRNELLTDQFAKLTSLHFKAGLRF
jgi:hypothetical protein